jgi:hypothetical protein
VNRNNNIWLSLNQWKIKLKRFNVLLNLKFYVVSLLLKVKDWNTNLTVQLVKIMIFFSHCTLIKNKNNWDKLKEKLKEKNSLNKNILFNLKELQRRKISIVLKKIRSLSMINSTKITKRKKRNLSLKEISKFNKNLACVNH